MFLVLWIDHLGRVGVVSIVDGSPHPGDLVQVGVHRGPPLPDVVVGVIDVFPVVAAVDGVGRGPPGDAINVLRAAAAVGHRSDLHGVDSVAIADSL